MPPNIGEISFGMEAAAGVKGDDGSASADGCQVARTSTGVYTLTLGTKLGVTEPESMILVTLKGQTPGVSTSEDTSDKVKTIHTFDLGGEPADLDFDVVIGRIVLSMPGSSA